MKTGKRFALICLILAALLLAACGASEPEPTQEPAVGMPNPIHEVDRQGLVDATGIPLDAPEGAEDVRFSYIELTNDNPIAQMNFTLDGAEAYLRVQATGELAPIDISGLYYDWTEQREVSVGSCSGFACTNGEAGYIAWLDVVPGLAYNLGMTEGASIDRLTELAGLVFAPVQGDA